MKQKRDVICLENVSKSFKIYKDKRTTFKERISRGRNRYTKHQVLNEINISIESGEVVGLIGENGCGKSTALKLISRILYPDNGTVTVEGRVSSLIELGAGFHQDLSGRENIYTNAAIFGLSKAEIDSRLNDIIDFSELWDFIDNPVRTYSSGMYTRLAFSVAINVDADILLIDEILSVGDRNFQKKCFDWLDELKNRGTTIIIVTHDTSSVENLCTRAIWLNDGKVAADGSPQKTVNAYYEYMYDKQFVMEKRLAEEHKKTEALKKDFTKEDVIELYRKYLLRDPESEETINNYYDYYDRKKDIEHTLKYSTERIAISKREKTDIRKASSVQIVNEASTQESDEASTKRIEKRISPQEVICCYRKYLDRDPDNEKVVEDCCNAFKRVDDLVSMIKQSPEYDMVQQQKKILLEKGIAFKPAAINGIEFLKPNGRQTAMLQSGEAYQLAIHYTVEQQIDKLAFGVEIISSNGYVCFLHNTLKSILNIGKQPGKYSVFMEIPVLFLFPGRYRLFASVIDEEGSVLFKERHLLEFEISGTCSSAEKCVWSTSKKD